MASDAFMKDLNEAESHVELTDVQRFRLRGMMMRLESEARRETARECLRIVDIAYDDDDAKKEICRRFGLGDGDG